MNKTENINIGGQPFIIDAPAYKALEVYLDSLERHFSGHEGCEDIMEDIELRISELFEIQLKERKVIEVKDLDAIKAIMGTAKDLGMEEESQTRNNDENVATAKLNKRFFRDNDSKVIGGVASGLASYFGMDVVWMRLIFILFVLSGISPLLYLILWAAVPSAKTRSEKMEMHGEPVNIKNIAKDVEEELMILKIKLEDFGNEIAGKKKDK